LLTNMSVYNGPYQTVNQPSYDFEGSSPSSPTILLRAKALRRIDPCQTEKQDALRSLGEGGLPRSLSSDKFVPALTRFAGFASL
jgi:hypothetical protein